MKTDANGNVTCKKCGKKYDPFFKHCPHCCKHKTLNLVSDYGWGDNDSAGWEIGVECAVCGKNYGWDKEDVIRRYKAVLR
jgi:hypothetical protein